MREIKFRAWAFSGGLGRYEMFDMEELCFVDCGSYSAKLLNIVDGTDKESRLMQYTGLQDKNGVDIYECDIISDGDPDAVGVVSFSESEGAWIVECESGSFFLYEAIGKKDCVIGNLYENPELLNA